VVGSDYDPGSLAVAKKGVYQEVEMLDELEGPMSSSTSSARRTRRSSRVKDVLRRRVRSRR